MKSADVTPGRHYLARVSGRLVEVELLHARKILRLVRVRQGRSRINYWQPCYRRTTVYDVRNLASGRRLTFRSAARLRPLPQEIVQ